MTELDELGLSSYEETVYRTLLATGVATAAELADASDVPRGRIYDVLNSLENRRLVATQSTEPTQYAAVDPESAVETLLAERYVELERTWARYLDAAESVKSSHLPTAPADGSVWLGSLGGAEMQTGLHEHVRTATESVHAVVGPPYGAASWDRLEREVTAFFDGAGAEIDVELILSERVAETVPESTVAIAERHAATTAIRTLPGLSLSFDVVDGAVTTIDLPHPRDTGDRIGVLGVTDGAVVDEFERQFRTMWREATVLRE
jgi:sugar-specific transcriptional regulator TrmB